MIIAKLSFAKMKECLWKVSRVWLVSTANASLILYELFQNEKNCKQSKPQE